MKVTFYGHATLGVRAGDHDLLFDPWITPNERAAHIKVDDVPADFVLLTHGHGDHIADAESVLLRTGSKLISNYEITSWYGSRGFQNAHALNQGGGYDFDFGRATFTNAVHSSSFPDGSYAGNPGGFVIESEDGNFYISGDTALTMDMKLIGEMHQLDWAALCIGDNFTMGPEAAARAAEFVGVRTVIGLHYDTFPPIEIDHSAARKAFSARGIELLLPAIGETVEL